jgi:hypothetical protein
MRCELPLSQDSSETSGAYELTHPVKIGDKIFGSLNELPKRFPAPYLINPAPGKIARTILHGPRNPRDEILGKRIVPVSRESALTNLNEEVDRELRQAQDNFATVFHASPAILCVIQLDGLRYREINKAYEQAHRVQPQRGPW